MLLFLEIERIPMTEAFDLYEKGCCYARSQRSNKLDEQIAQ